MTGLNIAVAGYGYWGRNIAHDIDGLGSLYAICDSNEQALWEARRLYPSVGCTPTYEDILTNHWIDGVIIATPSASHYNLAKQALEAGKDVLVEKPFTLSTQEAEELASLAGKKNRVAMVGYLMLYHPAVQLLRQSIMNKELGEIYYLYSTRVNLGQVRRDESIIWRLASHDVSILLYLMDGTPSVVSARGFSYIQDGLDDVAFAILQFGNAVAHIQVSWLDPHKVRQLTVVGSDRMAVFDDTNKRNPLRIYDRSVNRADLSIREGSTTIPTVKAESVLTLECKDFLKCMISQEKPLSDVTIGLDVTRVLESIDNECMRTKK